MVTLGLQPTLSELRAAKEEERQRLPAEPVPRAHALLTRLLPRITSHDDAMEHLYYLTPDATPSLQMYSIAAALFILKETEERVLIARRTEMEQQMFFAHLRDVFAAVRSRRGDVA